MMEVKKLISNLCLLIMVAFCWPGTAQAGPFAYVADSFEDWVSILDLGTDTATATVDVGKAPIGVAVSPDGQTVYSANRGSNDISVVDANSNTLSDTIVVGFEPQGVAVSPDGNFVYTAHTELPEYVFTSYLTKIDASTNEVADQIVLLEQTSNQIFDVKVSPDGASIYISNRLDDSISVVDASTFSLVDNIAVGSGPRGIAITPDSAKILVANESGGSISIIDSADNTVSASIDLGADSTPWRIAVNPDGTRAYVTMENGDTVKVIDIANETVVATVAVGDSPRGVDVNNDGSRAYVTNYWDNTVSIIDTVNNTVSKTVDLQSGTVPGGLDGIDIGPELRGVLSVASSISFADLKVGSSSSQTVTVANSGSDVLDIGDIASVDPLAAPYALTADNCSNTTLSPSESCTFKVDFTPSSAGEMNDSFDLPYTTDTSKSSSLNVSGFALSATGNLPPGKPQLVSPADNASGLGTSVELRWKTSTDPDDDAVAYKVYCSENADFSGASPHIAAAFLSNRALTAGLGASAVTLLLALPLGIRRHRTKICLLLALIASVSILSACGGGGGGGSSEPRSITPDEESLPLDLASGTTYYWQVVADDGKDGGARSSDIRTFSTQ